MGELKSGWRRVKFGEVVRLVSDRCDPVSAGIERFVGLEHIEPGDLQVRSWGNVADGTTFTNRFRSGQVLFGKRRAYQRKVAVADFDGVCSGDIYVLESANPGWLLPALLPFICQSEAFFEYAVGTSAGSLSPRTNWTSLAEYEFALPPQGEQRRLASVVAAARGTIESIFEALNQGEKARTALVAWLYRNGTHGESLRPTKLGDLPVSWKVEPLGARFAVQLGKMISETARAGEGHIPYLRNANVQWNRLDLEDVATMAFTPTEREKFSLRYGDILVCEGRHVGKSALWRDEIPGACYQKALHRLRPLGSDAPEYLLHCLAYYSMTGRFVAETGETTIPHLPAERFRAMLFPFPSREEQLEIAEAVNAMDVALESIRRRREASLQVLRTLLEPLGRS